MPKPGAAKLTGIPSPHEACAFGHQELSRLTTGDFKRSGLLPGMEQAAAALPAGGDGPGDASAPTSNGLSPAVWLMLAAITLAQATEAFAVQGFPTLIPGITGDLFLTKTQIGLLTSSFFAGGFVTVIPAGWLIDRIGVRLSLVLGLSSMAVFVALASRAASFGLLYACLFLSGIGFGSVYPATTKAVMHWAPVRWRGAMMGFKQTGVPLGGVLASLILPWLVLRSSWRGALLVAAAACAVCTVACHLMYQTHPAEKTVSRRPRPGRSRASGTADQTSLRRALLSRNIWLVNLSGLFLLGVQGTLVGGLVVFLTSGAGLELLAAGGALAAVQAGGAVGRLGWGTVSDALLGGRRMPIVAGLGLLSALTLWVLPLAPAWHYGALLLICGLAGLCALGWVGMVTVWRAELAPPGAVGIVTSMGSFTGYAGSLLAPPLFGLVLDRTGDFALAWRLLACCALAAALLASRAKEARSASQNRRVAQLDLHQDPG